MRTLSLCLRASAAGVGLRRSTARTYSGSTPLAFGLQVSINRAIPHPIHILLYQDFNPAAGSFHLIYPQLPKLSWAKSCAILTSTDRVRICGGDRVKKNSLPY